MALQAIVSKSGFCEAAEKWEAVQRTAEEDPCHVYFLDFGFSGKHFFSQSAGLILICPPQLLISEPLISPS